MAIIGLLLLTGCGEQVAPTRLPASSALNFYTFLERGEVDNAATYYLPNTLTTADRSQLEAASHTLRVYARRQVAAQTELVSDTMPLPNPTWLASAVVTVTAELQPVGGTWRPTSPVLTATLVSTSIGWRLHDFRLLVGEN